MRRSALALVGMAMVASVTLAGCGGGGAAADASNHITLTLAGWSLSSTPEFKTLADGYHKKNPNVTIELKEYDATNYDTQMTADLAAGKAPDIYVLKNLKYFDTYQSGNQLLDVSDVAAKLDPKETGGLSDYKVDGKTYAVPYRQDSWVLFYNKDLFDKAGVPYPDGSWTWDDYVNAAEKLTTNLKAAGSTALGTYQHTFQSTVQGFALAQTPGASLFDDNFDYLKPYYERALKLQNDGCQVSLGDATSNSLTYQAEFGTQKAAMMPMGSWYIATLVAQQADGEADSFNWGIAPAPQYDKSTTGTDKVPVTFGDPTGLGINPAIDKDKIPAAKDFLAYAAGVGGAQALAAIGVTPANTSAAVADTFFQTKGMPTDSLSKFAFSTHDTKPENPVSANTAQIQNILSDLHTAVLSNSVSIDKGISQAESRVKKEVQ